MKIEHTVKREQILEAALKRFSHFGITKTTFTEVADDLAVTKQSLSYYFPDKQSLIAAVIEKLTAEYHGKLQAEIELAATVEEALLKLIDVKAFFFEKYFMLFIQADHLEFVSNSSFQNWKQSLWTKEAAMIANLFVRGVSSGELQPIDSVRTANLFLETLYAFSRCVKDKGAFPSAADFKDVFQKQQEVIRLFYNGIKKEEWKK